MLSSTAHAIRVETDPGAPVLRLLAALDEAAPLQVPALIGHVGGAPAAALSLVDGRMVADPFARTGPVRVALRARATGILAVAREPSLRERMLARLGASVRAPRMAA
jgi:hypothetical protein